MLIPAAVLGCHGTLLICPLIIILPSHTPPAAAIEVKFPHQGFIPGLRNEKARGRLEESGPCRPRSYGRFWQAVSRRVWAVSRIWHAEPPALPIIPNTRLVKYQLDLPSPLRTHRYQTKKRITPLPILSLNFKTQNIPKIYPLSWEKKKRRRRDMRHLGSRRRKTKQKRSSELISLGVECLRPGGAVVSPFAAPPVRLPASKSVLRSLWRTEHPAKTQENDEMRESARPGSDRGDRCGGESN